MKVDNIFTLKDGSKAISGFSLWDDNISHKVGDTLIYGEKKWQVVAVDKIIQGCFGRPTTRYHALKLQPIDHDDLPNPGDILVKL
jgi:hypothetical protein